ncbi:MAG: SDR family NAD(P)-dependent oxidoreductase, partial [Gemmatimonadota bacterium]
MGDERQLAGFLDAARAELGGVSVLVHNASALATGPGLSDWEASLRVDLMAAVRASEQVAPWMEADGGGAILFVSSISGLEADPSPDYGYTAAKAALIAHAKKLGVMYAPRGIRVNAVAPG